MRKGNVFVETSELTLYDNYGEDLNEDPTYEPPTSEPPKKKGELYY